MPKKLLISLLSEMQIIMSVNLVVKQQEHQVISEDMWRFTLRVSPMSVKLVAIHSGPEYHYNTIAEST